MPSLKERLAQRLRAMRLVDEGPSRFGSGKNLAYSVRGKEFLHFHGDRVIDVRVPRREQRAWRGDPRVTFRKSGSDWIEFELRADADLDDAAHLAALAHADALRRAKVAPADD